MRFMILRKADAATEAGLMPGAELMAQMGAYHEELARDGKLIAGEGLRPSAKGLRVRLTKAGTQVIDGPFAESKELVAGFSMIDVASMEDAIAWVRGWPALDGGGEVELEIREAGCAGGLRGFDPVSSCADATASSDATKKLRVMVLLKADRDFEAGVNPGEHRLAAMAQRNEEGFASGVMFGAEGLQPSRRGARVKFSRGKPVLLDGPFAETKELIAGFWLLSVNSMNEAIDWVRRYPYPRDSDVALEIELRPLLETADFGAESRPESRGVESANA